MLWSIRLLGAGRWQEAGSSFPLSGSPAAEVLHAFQDGAPIADMAAPPAEVAEAGRESWHRGPLALFGSRVGCREQVRGVTRCRGLSAPCALASSTWLGGWDLCVGLPGRGAQDRTSKSSVQAAASAALAFGAQARIASLLRGPAGV